MSKTSALFELIQSMDASERSFFKKYSSRINKDKSKQYVKLFDAIAKQKSYDEPLLLKKFKNDTIAKHFTATKHYLYNSILDALEQFHKDKEIQVELNTILSKVTILHYKLLYKQALKLNEKGLKLAQKWGKKYAETRFRHFKMLIIRDEQNIKVLEEQLDPLMEDVLNAKSGYRDLIDLDFASAKRLIIIRKSLGKPIDGAAYKELKGLVDNLSENRCYNNLNRQKYFQIQMHVAEMGKYYDKAYYWAKRSVEDEFIDKQILTNVIIQYQNMLSRCITFMHYDEMPIYIDKIRNVHSLEGYTYKNQNVAFGQNRVFSYEIFYFFQTGQKEKCIEQMDEYYPFLLDYPHPEAPIWRIFMKSMIGLYRWEYDQIQEALDEINHILNISNPTILPQYQFLARAVFIGIQLDKGNHRLVEYKIDELSRYLKKAEIQQEICKKILTVYKKIYNAPNKTRILEIIQEFEMDTAEERKDFGIISGYRELSTVIIRKWKK